MTVAYKIFWLLSLLSALWILYPVFRAHEECLNEGEGCGVDCNPFCSGTER